MDPVLEFTTHHRLGHSIFGFYDGGEFHRAAFTASVVEVLTLIGKHIHFRTLSFQNAPGLTGAIAVGLASEACSVTFAHGIQVEFILALVFPQVEFMPAGMPGRVDLERAIGNELEALQWLCDAVQASMAGKTRHSHVKVPVGVTA